MAFCKIKMKEVLRFALLEGTIDDFVDEQENKNTRAKTDRHASLLKPFLQRKVALRNVKEMPPAQLNELLGELIFTVITKQVHDYEPTSWPRKRLRVLSNSSDKD